MTLSAEEQAALETLEVRIKTVLPEEYQDSYEDVKPVSMGSAGLKFGSDGKVAWDEIWGSFCDLALAGGPPHKGKLLEPGSSEEINAQPDRFREVLDEICRGVTLVTEITAEPSSTPGWVRMDCASFGMAGWLVRAIVMENVSARSEGSVIFLPAGPHYRLEKEIKNVITVIAKTCHYWLGHMWPSQHREIANLFAMLAVESPLVQPALLGPEFSAEAQRSLSSKMAQAITQATGLKRSNHQYASWLGMTCPDVRSAIWMMRALVVSNILARREETVLFVPVNAISDPNGETVVRALMRIHGFAKARGVL